jgi:RNA polymerase sigma-70 factor (ECF subfamily)
MEPLPRPDPPAPTRGVDPQLFARLRDGDVAAFEQLFRLHDATLRGFARRFIADADMAEDLVQEVWAWTWHHRETLQPRGELLAYLLAAVRHRALEQLRNTRIRHAATGRYVTPGDSPAMAVIGPRADDALERDERAAQIWRVVDTLGDPRRTILLLRWEYGQGWDEIASIVGLTVAAAKMQHSRALAVLRDRIPSVFR